LIENKSKPSIKHQKRKEKEKGEESLQFSSSIDGRKYLVYAISLFSYNLFLSSTAAEHSQHSRAGPRRNGWYAGATGEAKGAPRQTEERGRSRRGCHFCWKGRWPCPLTVYGGRDPLLLSVQYYYSEGKRASRLSRLP
jgi:hypothetical protein